MLTIHQAGARLCDGLSRRDMLHIGGLGALGLTLPELLRSHATAAVPGKNKACILLFLMGGPPQHSTWDPKPDAPAEVRGDFGPIATNVPGIRICELLPRTARLMDKICVLRAVSSGDNAHSSSGYYMITGRPHVPMNVENANPGPPNDWPSMGALVRQLNRQRPGMPASVTIPHRIFNTDGSVWPGQTAGFLGRTADPWLFTFNPGETNLRVADFDLAVDVPAPRLDSRRSLLKRVNEGFDTAERNGLLNTFDRQNQQAFDLLRATGSLQAFRLDREPASVRDRYGRSPFGQSVLLARRLVEAGVKLVQVNWYRGADEPADNPCWDSHTKESERLKNVLMPPMDQAYSALLEDLVQRGMLNDTLVVNTAEFGRTPRFNSRTGRDHWGYVYSTALAGGGVRGGQVIGASDNMGGHPKDGRVQPQDLTATVFHCLGYHPDTEYRDNLGRPLPISRGEVIRQAF